MSNSDDLPSLDEANDPRESGLPVFFFVSRDLGEKDLLNFNVSRDLFGGALAATVQKARAILCAESGTHVHDLLGWMDLVLTTGIRNGGVTLVDSETGQKFLLTEEILDHVSPYDMALDVIRRSPVTSINVTDGDEQRESNITPVRLLAAFALSQCFIAELWNSWEVGTFGVERAMYASAAIALADVLGGDHALATEFQRRERSIRMKDVADTRWAMDVVALAMTLVKEEWERWQSGKVIYANAAVFSRAMLDRHPALTSEGSIKTRCSEWAKERRQSAR